MAQALSSQHTNTFPDFLAQTGVSLLVSTYQAGKLIMLRHQDGVLNTHFTDMPKPMGITLQGSHLAIGTGFQLSHYYNMPEAGAKVEPLDTHNACYVPRETHITGDIDIHEMGFTDEGELWLVNTRMSCLCTISPEYSVVPRWHPPFISSYDLTDRCHLNGLAIKDGQPTYVSALGTTDTAAGWRKDKAHGGMLMDIRDNRMLASGLSMPHSPRWYMDKLWVLESGAGSLATVDVETGKLTTIIELPGFTRGIDFIGRYAVIGLSQVRETAVFAGLPLTERCQERQCGVYIVDIVEPKIIGFVVFSGEVQEIFSVQILPSSFPALLAMDDPLLRSTYSIPTEALKEFSAPDPEQTALEKANVLLSRRQFDVAIPAYQTLLNEYPDNIMARFHLGLAFLDMKQWKKAVNAFNAVLEKEPKHADAQLNLGLAWVGLRDWKKAIADFDKAIEIDLQFGLAHYHRALVLLHQNHYAEAWQELEWRWKMPGYTPLHCSQPQWQGEDIQDKTLLVHTEHNQAENIQFSRFLTQTASRCKRLIVLCPEPLRLLYKAVEGVDEVRIPGQGLREDFDVFIPLLSIPHLLDITQESIIQNEFNWQIPREVVVPTLQSKQALKVGLIWNTDVQAQAHKKGDTSTRLESFMPLLRSENVDFFSLQSQVNEDERVLLEKAGVMLLDQEMVSFAHTGALINQLDLVIGVDNSMTHLAASLGKTSWVLLDSNSSWVWQENSEKCDWYPSARLFREDKKMSEEELVKKIKSQLSKYEVK